MIFFLHSNPPNLKSWIGSAPGDGWGRDPTIKDVMGWVDGGGPVAELGFGGGVSLLSGGG